MKGAKTVERGRKPLGFSKTVAIAEEAPRGRPRRVQAPGRPSPAAAPRRPPEVVASPRWVASASRPGQREGGHRIRPLVEEWLMELRVMGRSPRTIAWYRQKFDWYRLQEGAPVELQDLNGYELKRVLAGLQERGLKPNTVHGFFETMRAFGNWAHREGYPIDASLLRVRPPSVPITELETYSKSLRYAKTPAHCLSCGGRRQDLFRRSRSELRSARPDCCVPTAPQAARRYSFIKPLTTGILTIAASRSGGHSSAGSGGR
jgi:hypothetical protein